VIFAYLIQAASNLPTNVSALQGAIPVLESQISALESEIKALENSSVPWEHKLPWFTGIVAFGVAMELLVIWHDYREESKAWRRGTIRPPDRPSAVKLLVEVVSVVFITAGIVGELWVGLKITSINGAIRAKSAALQSQSAALRSKNEQLVRLLSVEAGDAEKDAGDANQRAAELNRQAEQERLARAKIEAAVTFRSLDDQQKSDMATALARFGNITAASIWFANGSPEAELFADDIAEALRFAHIHTTAVGAVMEMREGGGDWDAPIKSADTGVVISSTSNPTARELADALLKEITSMGFDATRGEDQPSKDKTSPSPVIWVTVRPRPKGPQGKYKLEAEQEAQAKRAKSKR
jgi:hypothetical protein